MLSETEEHRLNDQDDGHTCQGASTLQGALCRVGFPVSHTRAR